MKIPHKTLERKLFQSGYDAVIGIDEVGMGCLAGPVTVCAVILTSEFYKKNNHKLIGLRESKLLTARQREKYSQILKNLRMKYVLVSEPPRIIDKINIYQASRKAMKKAIKRLDIDGRPIVLVDGPHKISKLGLDQLPIVKGDQKIFVIACASVLAKVYRDNLMVKLAKKYPGYGLEIHKGYGTSFHRQRIHKLGLTPLHRRSFNVK